MLVIAGIEHVVVAPGSTKLTPLDFVDYPLSHGLLMSLVWALVFGGAYFLYRRSIRPAIVVAALVVCHWALDAIVHRPELLLFPGGSTRIGFGLWISVVGTVAVELGMSAVGFAIYLRSTQAKDRVGRLGLFAFACSCWSFAPGQRSAPRHRARTQSPGPIWASGW
jgi:hypothetical protein